MNISIELIGLKEIEKSFNEKLKKVRQYSVKGMTDVVLDLLSESVQLAPVDTGDLRGSGSASINKKIVGTGSKDGNISTFAPPSKAGDEISGEVGFSAEYAFRQHEDMTYNHPQGGQAKYLEIPLNRKADQYIEHLKGSIDKAVEDGDI